MRDIDDYHYARAVAELNAAQRSLCPEAVQAHCALAELHLERSSAGHPSDVLDLQEDPRAPAAWCAESPVMRGTVLPLKGDRKDD
ncbi:hypothetical protein [Sphingomonas pokkalii]|uniref:Uncharacterized protein n=1 Tax=Sphingomonas pokkalii TaxID=2175090 RepID=A0A2U0SDG4_9SPHN|nr:hypothetical protein [Sphingomonas pokkalii]PVX29331.1 hypothetical protein DD559_08370 [Sphingomonas pokkalii]